MVEIETIAVIEYQGSELPVGSVISVHPDTANWLISIGRARKHIEVKPAKGNFKQEKLS